MSDRNPLPFVRQSIATGPGYIGSRWWNEMLEQRAAAQSRRGLLIGFGLGGTVAALLVAGSAMSDGPDDAVETTKDALDLQRTTSWNVGGADRALTFPGASRTDVDGGPAWQAPLVDGHLDEALRPVDGRLQPFYVPTLFQAPAAATAQGLAAALSPISTPATETAFLRGQALATLLKVSDSPPGVALIVDVPGPEAVAVAAGLADVAAPVFTFANWPHPLGVVSAHLTLGAALYYLPLFRRMDVVRPQSAPPAFILDANRLAPYRDQASEFDNRYVASLPSVESLRALGIQRLLYVRSEGDGLQELDDLNTDLSTYQQAGIEVRGLALADFRPDGETAPARDAGAPPSATAGRLAPRTTHYYWGGWLGGRSYFWSYYGWNARPTGPAARAAPPITVSRAGAYRPVPRPTMFSVRTMGGAPGIGKQKPSGFGRVSIRTTRGGVVTTGRTGSFGRTRFFSGGG